MTLGDFQRRGFLANGVFAAANLVLMIAINSQKGKLPAVSYGYGAAVAQLFSLSWFILNARGFTGAMLMLAVFSGYFFRIVFLFLFFAIAYKILAFDIVWCAAAFLFTRFILLGIEIAMAWHIK